ncbi:hypothetical protein BC834DRAFT_974998 [Gloeopeniophorella convolvens]|nr:hypothetical protein BC834DRAFT_974998 [Gloeopeniophorella convolvens]
MPARLGDGFSIPAGNIGVAVLESLTPRAPVPAQLRQATAALKFLLKRGTPSSGIITAGDLAGGNLCLELSAHLLHPLEGAAPPAVLSEPLAGAAPTPPWVTFHEKGVASYKRNDALDWIPRAFYDQFAAQVRPGVTPVLRAHVEPLEAPQGW